MSGLPIVVKLGGGNGSGKSSVARALLGKDYQPSIFLQSRDDTGRRTTGYSCVFEGLRVLVIGKYETACGGIDALHGQLEWLPLVEQASALRDIYDVVFFEGILSGQTFGRCGAFSDTQVGRWIYAAIDAPVEVCLERIMQRRQESGNTKPRTPALEKSVKNAHRCAMAVPPIAAAHGHYTLVLDYHKTPEEQAREIIAACKKVAADAG